MPNAELERERSCGDKKKYKNKEWALEHKRRMPELEIYRCRFCKSWHLGHPKKK